MDEGSPVVEIAAWVASIIGGIVACVTLAVILYDRRVRLKITIRVGRPVDVAQRAYLFGNALLEALPLALFIRMTNASRTEMLMSDVYLQWAGGRTMSLRSCAINLTLPSVGRPGEEWNFYVLMKPLTQALRKEGHILSANVSLVVQDGLGNLHRKRIQIYDILIWVRDGNPTPESSGVPDPT